MRKRSPVAETSLAERFVVENHLMDYVLPPEARLLREAGLLSWYETICRSP